MTPQQPQSLNVGILICEKEQQEI